MIVLLWQTLVVRHSRISAPRLVPVKETRTIIRPIGSVQGELRFFKVESPHFICLPPRENGWEIEEHIVPYPKIAMVIRISLHGVCYCPLLIESRGQIYLVNTQGLIFFIGVKYHLGNMACIETADKGDIAEVRPIKYDDH